MHGICICVFITRSACTSCTLLSYICYRFNLSIKVCPQAMGHYTERKRESLACSKSPCRTSSPSTDSSCSFFWHAQHHSLPKPLDWHTGWTGHHHPTTAGTGWHSWHWHHPTDRLWCPSQATEPCSSRLRQCIPIWNAFRRDAAAVPADDPEDGHDASQQHARLQ